MGAGGRLKTVVVNAVARAQRERVLQQFVSVLPTGSRTGNPVRPWLCDTASLGGAGALVGL